MWGRNLNRFVVMVDAGYLLRQSIEIVSSRASHSRSDLQITDPKGLISLILEKSRATLDLSSKELLRVYWYDGVMANGLSSQQRSLVDVDDVQFRGGTVNGRGQQKGVDSLIVTDLIELTSHHAMCDAVLVTGDSDLAVGIELAQRRGVRIAVLGVEDLQAGVSHSQSFEITSRADRVGRIGGSELAPFMRHVPAQQPTATPAATRVGREGAVPQPDQAQVTQATTPAQAAPAASTAVQTTPSAPVPVAAAQIANVSQGQPAVSVRPPPPPLDLAKIQSAVDSFVKTTSDPATTVDPATKRIDGDTDRALIHCVFTAFGRQLTNQEKIVARKVYRTLVAPNPS